jgi:GGDEF domain-containing protein
MEESLAASDNRWEQVHVAMGLAVYDEAQDRSAIDTMRRADKKMYAYKKDYKAARKA